MAVSATMQRSTGSVGRIAAGSSVNTWWKTDALGPQGDAWRVFVTCWLVYTAFWTPYLVREHFPAISLMETGSLNVERYLGWSEDIFRGARGGAYINNNPGASLTAAVPLFVLRPVLRQVESGIGISLALCCPKTTQNSSGACCRRDGRITIS